MDERGRGTSTAAAAGRYSASVVICVRRDDRIVSCLEAIFGSASSAMEDFEVILVENDDAPRYEQLANRYPIRYLVEPVMGMHRTRQLGVAAARGNVVVCTDADCIPQAGWLSSLLAPFADPDVEVVGGRIVKPQARSWVEACQPDLGRGNIEPQYLPRISPLPFAVTANAAFRRDTLGAVGGLDSEMLSGGDVDVCWRVLRLGGRLAHAPDAVVVHACRPTIGAIYRQYRTYSRGHAHLFSKHRTASQRWCVDPYPLLAVARAAESAGRGLLSGDVRRMGRSAGELAIAMTEALGLVDGAVRGSFAHRVLYL
jgi:GT2 family glycosyltransferase